MKQRRAQLGISQTELAKTLDLSRQYLARIEKGRNISRELMVQIANALQCQTADLWPELVTEFESVADAFID